MIRTVPIAHDSCLLPPMHAAVIATSEGKRCAEQAISPAWTDFSGFERLHSLSLIDYPHAGRIVNSPMVCLPRCLRSLEINDLRNFQVRPTQRP